MKVLITLAFLCLNTVFAQTGAAPAAPAPAVPNLPDNTVLATLDDGTSFTMGDFKKLYAVLPEQNQQAALRNRQDFLRQYAMMRKLARIAENEKLDGESPTKEMLEYYRLTILSQAALSQALALISVPVSDASQYYEAHKDDYKEVKVKAIYLTFGSGKRTEDEAKSKAAKLLADARGGADFVKLVKDNSEDNTSKAKNGDFATIRRSDNVPDAIRTAVFELKPGELTEPVRQPNGYYVFRAESVGYRPLADVQDDILNMLKQARWSQWLEKTNRETKIEYKSPEFFGTAPAEDKPGK